MITPERLLELRTHYAPAVTVDYACAAIVELLDEVDGLTASRNYGRDIINDMSLEAADLEKRLPVWVAVADHLPAYGQPVFFWQRQHQMIGPGNLPDTIPGKAYAGWFDTTPSTWYPTWSDKPEKHSFYNNSNGLHDLALISHWMPLPDSPTA